MSDQREESAWMPSFQEIGEAIYDDANSMENENIEALIRRAAAKRALQLFESAQAEQTARSISNYVVDFEIAQLRKELEETL